MKRREHITDLMFVILLLLMFASFGLCVVMIGARVYQTTVNHMEENDSSRTALAYIEQKIRQNNEVGKVKITTIEENQSLAIYSMVNKEEYVTYIYCYEGKLWELYTKASNEARLGMGQSLVSLKDFSIEDVGDGIYRIKVVSSLNKSAEVSVHLLEEKS